MLEATVGIFDSGVGGLSVVAALHALRPSLPIRYLADTAFFPYGDRSSEEVTERALALAQLLIDDGCTVLVVACNTASSAALEALRAAYTVPIVGMEPPLKPALERSINHRVAVLATTGTSSGARLARLRDLYGVGADVAVVPMPGLADLVEAGEVTGERVERVLRTALELPMRDGIDTVALGCTHYSFVRAPLEAILPPGVQIVDAAEPVARRALFLLGEAAADSITGEPRAVICYATGDARTFVETIERLRAAGAKLPPLEFAPLPTHVSRAAPGSRA